MGVTDARLHLVGSFSHGLKLSGVVDVRLMNGLLLNVREINCVVGLIVVGRKIGVATRFRLKYLLDEWYDVI